VLRRLVRFALLFLVLPAFLPLAIASRALALAGAGNVALRMAARTQRRWARVFLRVLGVELEVEGELPSEACLVVANHLSYLDIVVLSALFPGRFVAKSEIASWPILGAMASSVGTIFVVQKRRRDVVRVEREMTRTLRAGVPVVLFPEGGSSRGVGVEPFKSSLLECAALGRHPCLAAALGYETPGSPWAPAATVCWWGGMDFWRHAWGLVGLPRVRARVSLAPELRSGSDRKALAARLREDVLTRFIPMPQEPAPPDTPWPELFRQAAPGRMVSSGLPE